MVNWEEHEDAALSAALVGAMVVVMFFVVRPGPAPAPPQPVTKTVQVSTEEFTIENEAGPYPDEKGFTVTLDIPSGATVQSATFTADVEELNPNSESDVYINGSAIGLAAARGKSEHTRETVTVSVKPLIERGANTVTFKSGYEPAEGDYDTWTVYSSSIEYTHKGMPAPGGLTIPKFVKENWWLIGIAVTAIAVIGITEYSRG